MSNPDLSLIIWQILAALYLSGAVFALVRFSVDRLLIHKRIRWGLIILIIPLGWILYLIFRKQLLYGSKNPG